MEAPGKSAKLGCENQRLHTAFGFGAEEVAPVATERGLKPDQRGNQDGDVARFNLLNGSRIQRTFFCELLLREFSCDPRSADGVTQLLQRSFLSLRSCHALLRRDPLKFDHALLGREVAWSRLSELGQPQQRQ